MSPLNGSPVNVTSTTITIITIIITTRIQSASNVIETRLKFLKIFN